MYELNSFNSFRIYINRTVLNKFVFNSPGVTGVVLQTPLSFIHSVGQPFFQKSSKHLLCKTIRARDMKFGHNVYQPLCVICDMSSVICHVSLVMCDM